MRTKPLSLTAVLLMLALFTAACGGSGGAQSEFTISVSDDFQFSPATVTVKAGEPVSLTFENSGFVEHSFAILNADANLEHMMEEAHDEEALHEELFFEMHEVAGGQSQTETFIAPAEAGDYTFTCLIPGHADAGEVGTLTVVP